MTTVERTQRWRSAFVFALVLCFVGVYTQQALFLVAALVGIGYTAYPLVTSEPAVELALSRTVSDERPDHGDSVTVTVTVTNVGRRTLSDLRIIDGVPDLLTVTGGTPRHSTVLEPDESTTFRYTVAAKHGRHQFDPATVITYDISGSTRVQTELTDETETTTGAIDASVDVRDITLRRRTQQRAGQTQSDRGGSGVEFFQTREYRYGDPASRVDWRQFARTGELSTVEFREDHLTTVVLAIDARAVAARTRRVGEPHAVAYSAAAASAVASRLFDQGERVGTATFGSELTWRPPGAGDGHRREVIESLEGVHAHSAPSEAELQFGADQTEQAQTFLTQVTGPTEVILFSPLLDEFGATTAQYLETTGHTTTVISPDVTTETTLSGEFVRVERDNRIATLRSHHIPVRDWTPAEPLRWPVPMGGIDR